MYTVLALNNISPQGLSLLPRDHYSVVEHNGEGSIPASTAIVLRSANLHDTSAWLSPETLALARAGAGTNNIPVAQMSDEGVVVFNTPGANANSVKELVLATMIMAMRHVPSALKKAEEIIALGGDVLKAAENAKKAFSGQEIAGKTLGVIGLGQIGVLVANAAHDLGMQVVGYDPEISVRSAWRIRDGVTQVDSLEELLSEADVVTLHVPFFEGTKHLLGPKKLRLLKPRAIVLNFARDGIVDDDVMLQMLHEGRCSAYITDFLSVAYEGLSNVIQLPHLGASTGESEERCAEMAVRQLRDYLENGNIVNSVNYPNVSLKKRDGTRIVVLHRNVPGMLGDLSQILGKRGINISRLQNDSKGDFAATILDVEKDEVSSETETLLREHADVLRVRVITPA